MTNGGKEDIASGFIGLGFQADAEIVSARLDVGGDGVEAFAVAVECGVKILGGVVFCAFASAPHDEGCCAEFCCEVDVTQDLSQAEAADLTVIIRQSAIFKHRVGEGIGCHHFDDESGCVGNFLDVHDSLMALRVRGIEVEDIIVMECNAPGADFCEFRRVFPRIEDGSGAGSKGINRVPSHGPQAEREAIFGSRCMRHSMTFQVLSCAKICTFLLCLIT